MVEEYWLLGEALQDRILASGYSQDQVDGIAVDIHDLLQAADLVRDDLARKAINADPVELRNRLLELRNAFHHLAWHGESGTRYLDSVLAFLAEEAQETH